MSPMLILTHYLKTSVDNGNRELRSHNMNANTLSVQRLWPRHCHELHCGMVLSMHTARR